MWKAFKTWCLKIGLSALPDIAVSVTKYTASKVDANDPSSKSMTIINVLEKVSQETQSMAKALKDGNISAEEEKAIKARVSAIVEEVEDLL